MKRTFILAPMIGAALLLTACGGGTPAPPATQLPVVQLPVVPPVTPPETSPITPPSTDPDKGKTLGLPTLISLNAGSNMSINLGQLSFSAGRTIKITGLASGVTAHMEGKVLVIESAAGAAASTSNVQVTYGAPGSAALLSQATTVVVNGAATPDPELGIKIRPEAITLNDQNPSAQVSLGYLSLAGGRTIKFGNLPPDVSWTLNAATKTGTLTRQAGAWASNRTVTVNYVDPTEGIIASGEWKLSVQAAPVTPPPTTYFPVVSDMATWSEVERKVLGYINEVRTQRTVDGRGITITGCVADFTDTNQPMLPVDAGQVAARKHAQYAAVEGLDGSVGPDGVRAHFQYNKASPAYYGFSYTDRLARAVAETPSSKAAGFKAVSENIFAMSNAGAAIGTDELAIAAVTGWLSSPGHCPQIMDPKYRFIGVGHVYNPSAVVGSTMWQHSVVMNPFY